MGKDQKKIKPQKIEKSMKEDEIGNDFDKEISIHRGKVVHYVTELEFLTEQIILNYFELTKSEELSNAFVHSFFSSEGFGLSSKHTILGYIITNIFPNFKENHPYLLDTFDSLIKTRNRYAHDKVVRLYRSDYKVYILSDVKTKGGKPDVRTSLLNDETLEKFYGKYWNVKTELQILLDLIKKRQ